MPSGESNTPRLERDSARGLEFLVRSSRRLNASLELPQLVETTRELVLEALACEAVSLFVFDEERGRLVALLARNRVGVDGALPTLELGRGLAGWVYENGRPARIDTAEGDPRVEEDPGLSPAEDVRQVLAVPLSRGRHVQGVLEAINKAGGGASFTREDEDLLAVLSENVALALENADLYRRGLREKREIETLYRIGLQLSRTLELREILPRLLTLLEEVIPYDAGAIYLVDTSGVKLDLFTARGYEPETERRAQLKLGQGAVGWVAKNGKALLMEDVAKDSRYFAARPTTRSELVVPMIAEEFVLGAFNVESDRLGAFGPRDVRLLTTFAAQAAVSIQRARLHEEALQKRRLQQEIHIARGIQERLFPRKAPVLRGFDLAGLNRPSREVSGDLYDFVTVVPGHVGIMIADVSGKGVPAALVGATLRAGLRMEIQNSYAIGTIFRKVNTLLLEGNESTTFVTGVYGVLDEAAGQMTYSNAGHNPPLWLRSDDTVEWLWTGGTILGAFPDVAYQESVVRLLPGDVVVFYTDGITEALNPEGEEFGLERLVACVRAARHGSAKDICEKVIREARLHEGAGQADDLTVVVLKSEQ